MKISYNPLLYVLTYPLSWFSRWVPKSNNLWVFGSWHGTQYNDNSKYLFRYVNHNHPEIRAVWLTRSKETVSVIRQEGYECYLMYSFFGVLSAIRAHIAILSRAKAEDLPIFISPYSTKLVQLWHGTPLKKLGKDKQGCVENLNNSVLELFKKIVRRVVFPQANNNYSIFIAPSEEIGQLFKSAYGHWMKPDAIKVTGYPRNDELHVMSCVNSEIRGIYVPTFRDWDRSGETLFSSYGFDADKLDKELGRLNVKLDMKLHPETKLPDKVASTLNRAKNIEFVHFSDIYEYLGQYDFIITDYSSIYFDFLTLDRPVIFTPFDHDEYVSGRGLYYNYTDVTPGLKAYSWGEVYAAIEKVVDGCDLFKEQRGEANIRFNEFRDANSCQRVVDEISLL